MSNNIRVGVVGTSDWADFMYMSSLYNFPLAKLVAVCGRDHKRTKAIADKYNIDQVFTNYQELIKHGDLDLLIVGTPDDLHHPITLNALEAGLHVICDKPIAVSVPQAWEMYAAAEQSDRRHMVLFTYRYMPFFRFVFDLVSQGLIGRFYNCEFRYLMGYARQKEYQWRLDKERANGALGDLGVHMIDMARWLVGEITRVSAITNVFVERPGANGGYLKPANDTASLLVEFENGAQGTIHTTLVALLGDRFMQQQVKLYGEDGSLELDIQYDGAEAGVTLRIASGENKPFDRIEVPISYWGNVNRSQPFEVFKHQSVGCRAFVEAVVNNHTFKPDFYDGYKAQQVIGAALQSNDLGNWVSIDHSV